MKVSLIRSLLILAFKFKFSHASTREFYDLTQEIEDVNEMRVVEQLLSIASTGKEMARTEEVIDLSSPVSSPPPSPKNTSSSGTTRYDIQYISNNLLSFTRENLTDILTALGPEEYKKSLKPHCNWNLLHEAVFTDNVPIANLLIDKFGFDPNAWDSQFGNCVYMVNSVQMVQMLQAHGTDFSINVMCHMYDNPAYSALMRGNASYYASKKDFQRRLNFYLDMIVAQQARHRPTQFGAAPDKMYAHFIRKVGKFDSVRNSSATIEVTFTGQPGVDQGGLTKSFITQMKNEMKNGGKVFQSDPDTGVLNIKFNAPLDEVRAAGFLVGLSIFHKTPLNVLFAPIIYHLIVAKQVHRDINFVSVARESSESVMKSFENIKKYPDEMLEEVEFPEIEGDKLRTWKRRRTSIGTRENISDFIKISAKNLVYGQRAKEYQEFLFGLGQAIDLSQIGDYLTTEELKLVIGGDLEDYSGDDIKNNAVLLQYIDIFPIQYAWLFEIINEITPEQRRRFLKYFTSLECLPIGGFAALDEKIKIEMLLTAEDPDKYFPQAGTCTNTLKIFPYTSKAVMKAKIIESIEIYEEGFHIA